MFYKQLQVSTEKRETLIDVTASIRAALRESGISNGRITLFVPHTTAAVTINENADPTVPVDLVNILNKLIPQSHEYRHMEGNSDAHAKSSLVGCSETVLVLDGQLVLGTWQGIFFCEFDGPRNRKLIIGIE
jgi:secondary thiamine-phosphate synthase enzyme